MSKSVAKRQHVVNMQKTVQHAKAADQRTKATVPRTKAADQFSRLAFQVLQLAALLSDIGDTLAKPAGQTSARWQVLAAIEEEALSVAEIARRLGQSRQSVQRIADVLTNAKYTHYQDNPAHQRAKLLGLSSSGKHALQEIQRRQAIWANEVSASLKPSQLEQASQTLQEVFDQLRDTMAEK